MTVGNETRKVVVSDCIIVPSNEPHGLLNDGNSILIYFSAASPSLTQEELLSFGHFKVNQTINS